VIVSNCSGPSEYATNENSYMIPLLEGLDDEGFSLIDEEKLTLIMKEIYEKFRSDSLLTEDVLDENEKNCELREKICWRPSTKGLAARETIKLLSPSTVVAKIVDRLRYHANIRGWDDI